jgi:hypothetical protein
METGTRSPRSPTFAKKLLHRSSASIGCQEVASPVLCNKDQGLQNEPNMVA